MPTSLLDHANVSEARTRGSDLVKCLRKLELVLADEPRDTQVASLYIMAVLLQAPDLTDEQLQQAVWELSKTTCLILAGTDTPVDTEVKH